MTGKDGNIYQITGPEGLNKDTVQAEILKRAPQAGIAKKEAAGFFGSFYEGAKKLPEIADEVAAFRANPNEKTRRALIKAGESKYRSVGFGEGENWEAFKQALGGSLGEMLAPAAAGLIAGGETAATFVGAPAAPFVGIGAAALVGGSQYTAQNLLRQAQEQERAIAEGKTPGETSTGKALVAAAGQTALDAVGARAFSGVAKLFPFMRPLLGKAGGKAAQEAGEVLTDAAAKGTISFSRGVAKGVGKGVAFEVPQEVAQSVMERWQAGLATNPFTDEGARSEYTQAAIGAAVLGGTFGAVSGGFESAGSDAEPKPPGVQDTPFSNIPTEMLDSVEKEVITTPEDKAEYDELVSRWTVSSGIPEELARKYALGTIAERKKAERAQRARETGATEEAEEAEEAGTEEAQQVEPKVATDEEIEAAMPGIEQEFKSSLIDFAEAYGVSKLDDAQKAQAARIIIESPEVDAYDAIDSVLMRGIETTAVTQPTPDTATDIQPASDVALDVQPAAAAAATPIMQPTADTGPILTPIQEAAEEPSPLRAVYDAPNMKARVKAATPIVSSIIESIPGMADVKVPTKLVGAAARQMAQLAANQQTFDPVQIITDALTASGIVPKPVEAAPATEQAAPSIEEATAPVFEEPTAVEPTAAPAVELVQEPVQRPVPFKETVDEALARGLEVKKVAAAAASGTKPVQRGKQGNKKGRPVEGAAELTPGMQAQGALNTDLQAALDNQEITNAEMREVVDYMRAPENRLELRDKPEDIRPQWRRVLDLSDKVELQQQFVYDMHTKDPARPAAQATLDELKSNLNAAQTDIANSARAKFDAARTSRVSKRQEVEDAFKAGEITERERRVQLGELRISPAEGDLKGETTELASKVIEVAKQTRKLKPVLELLAQQDSKLGELARRALPLIRDIPVIVVSPDMMRSMARKPGEKLDDTTVIEGLFVPERNTIFLNSELQYDHVVLHEALHSIIDGHISRNTPAGAELKSIYKMFKELASTEQQGEYGFTDAHEFVAEAWSNDSFRKLLQELTPVEAGAKPQKNLLQRMVDTIKSLFEKTFGSKKAAEPAVDYVERVMRIVEAAAAEQVESTKGPSAAKSKKVKTKAEEKMDRGLYKAQMSNTASGLTEGIDEAIAGAKLTWKEKRGAMLEALSSGVSAKALYLYPTSVIRKAISNKLPGLGSIINGIDRLEQNMRGMRTSMRTALGRRVREFEKFVNKYGQGAMASMMTIARVNRVDVTAYDNRAEALANDPVIRFEKARNNAKGVTKREKAVNTAWDAWEALGKQPGGHAMYKKVRQFYKDMHLALRAAQDQDIRNLGLDKKATDRLIREARGDVDVDEDAVTDADDENPGVPQKLFPKEYFPFRRFGKYALVVKNGKRAERERYHFDSAKERNLFELQVAKKLGLQRGSAEYNSVFTRLDGLENLRDDIANNEGRMLKRMFEVIDKARVEAGGKEGSGTIADESLKNKLYQTYLLTLPERSLQKQLIHAKLVPGQSADVLNVFRTSVAQYSAQLPKVVYGGQIQKQIEAAYDSISNELDPAERTKVTTLVDGFVRRVRATNDAEAYGWKEQLISSFTFLSVMTSVASAAVQPFTIPLQVMPRMVARYGPVKAFAALGKYTPVFSLVQAAVDVDPVTGARALVAPTIGNTKFIKSNPLRARLWNELNLKRDLFSQKQTDMLLRDRPTKTTSRDTVGSKIKGGYEGVVDASGALFSSADQITREISGMSFAELEYNRLKKAGKSHEAAIEGAVEAAVNNTNETIGNYTELEKLDVFRGDPLRRMLGFLRTYSVQRTAYYFRMLKAVVKEDPTQTKLQAFNELSMVLVFTSAAAGFSANFGYSAICSLLDFLIPMFMDDDEMEEWRRRDPLGADDADYRFRFQWLPQNFGSDSMATRAMQKGLLTEVTGWDWSTRLSQSNLWLREGREGEDLKDDVVNWLVANLSPQVSQSANMIDGIDDFTRGEYSKGFSKLLPAAVRGIVTAERQAREGDTTKNNKTVRGAGEFTPTELFGQGLGFTPDELSRKREINRTTSKWQRSMRDERRKLFAEFRSVYGDGDKEGRDVVFEQMRRFNAKIPLDSKGKPVPEYLIEGKDLARSLQSAENIDEKSYRGIEYNDGEEKYFFPYERREPVVK
jgi:hypothetical protein